MIAAKNLFISFPISSSVVRVSSIDCASEQPAWSFCHPLGIEVGHDAWDSRPATGSNTNARVQAPNATNEIGYLFTILGPVTRRCARDALGAGCGILPVARLCDSLTDRMHGPLGLLLVSVVAALTLNACSLPSRKGAAAKK